jgi:hypothetical protein
MEYSMEKLMAIVQAHPQVFREIEARDTVFRRKFDTAKLRGIPPWIMLGRYEFDKEEFDLWVKLQNNDITNFQAIEMMTDLMERYYGQKYPLRREQ